MANTLRHRGPDDSGVWLDAKLGVGLAHRRLAVIDLSENGHQPMVSKSGRYVLVYNGEAYNYQEMEVLLARSLGQRKLDLCGHCDSEVILAAVDHWGLDHTIEMMNGMFALAIWDRHERKLHLVRDRLGIKPVYYGFQAGSLVFASELKAIAASQLINLEIDAQALDLYLRHNHIPSPKTIYRDVFKLNPGTVLTLDADQGTPVIRRFWSWEDTVRKQQDLFKSTDEEVVSRFEAVLSEAVRKRMMADVPLGAFLSGGVDSSLVVSMMQDHSETPVQTFCMGFTESSFDESPFARKVAGLIGTQHREMVVTPGQALDLVPALATIYDEPFADPSQLPTILISQMTRRHVTVALSGDGGDELTGGYHRYAMADRLHRCLRMLPGPARGPLVRLLRTLGHRALDPLTSFILRWNRPERDPRLSSILLRLAELAEQGDDLSFYTTFMSVLAQSETWVHGNHSPSVYPSKRIELSLAFRDQMLVHDGMHYLPDVILTKVDRASMAYGLEVRVPLLDHNIVEHLWRLPGRFKSRNGSGKWIFREILERRFPRGFFTRSKMGFAVPIGEWLRGPLRDWAVDLLDPHAMSQAGYLDPAPIQAKWQQHLSGDFNWQYPLWNVLMFQAWMR